MTANQSKLEIAKQLCYRAKDVSVLTGYSLTIAYEIMRTCREQYGGAIPLRPDAIKAESLMRYFGTTQRDYIVALGEADR